MAAISQRRVEEGWVGGHRSEAAFDALRPGQDHIVGASGIVAVLGEHRDAGVRIDRHRAGRVEPVALARRIDFDLIDRAGREIQVARDGQTTDRIARRDRSEEHTSELQSPMRTSYAVFCLKKKKTTNSNHTT